MLKAQGLVRLLRLVGLDVGVCKVFRAYEVRGFQVGYWRASGCTSGLKDERHRGARGGS